MRKPATKRTARAHPAAHPRNDVPTGPEARNLVLGNGAAAAFTFMGVVAFFIPSENNWIIAAAFGALGLIMAGLCLRSRHARRSRGFLLGVAAGAGVVLIAAFLMRGR